MTTPANPPLQSTPESLSIPEKGSFGFLVTNTLHRSSPFAGMSRFEWFNDQSALERALATAVVAFGDHGPKSVALAQYAAELVPVVDGWESSPVSLEERRNVINEVLRNDSHIAWIGSFETLCQADAPFERDVRHWYRKEEGIGGDHEPIALQDQGAFGCALQGYGL